LGKTISQILIEKMQTERYKQLQNKNDTSKESKKLYMYQNITTFDVILPRATNSGRKIITGREKFVGGEWYKQVPELMCLNEIFSPEAQEAKKEENLVPKAPDAVKPSEPQLVGESTMAEKEKILLTEIPEVYKEEGKVEYVMKQDNEQVLQESEEDKKEAKKKKLIKESGAIKGVKFFN
jgi:hypothetical protein